MQHILMGCFRNRYDPPIELPRMASTSEDSLNIRIGETGPQGTFGFVVARDSTGTKIWDTSIGKRCYLIRLMSHAITQ